MDGVGGIFGMGVFGDEAKAKSDGDFYAQPVAIHPPSKLAADGFRYVDANALFPYVKGLRAVRFTDPQWERVSVFSATGANPTYGTMFDLSQEVAMYHKWQSQPDAQAVFLVTTPDPFDNTVVSHFEIVRDPVSAIRLRANGVVVGQPGVNAILKAAVGEGVTFDMRDGLAVLNTLGVELAMSAVGGVDVKALAAAVARGDVVMFSLPHLGRQLPTTILAGNLDPPYQGPRNIAQLCSSAGPRPDGQETFAIFGDSGQPMLAAARKLIREAGKQPPPPNVLPPEPKQAGLGGVAVPLLVIGAAGVLVYAATRKSARR